MLEAFLLFLKDFAMPEALKYVESYLATNGKLPTIDELNANVFSETNEGITKGFAWLASKGIQ